MKQRLCMHRKSTLVKEHLIRILAVALAMILFVPIMPMTPQGQVSAAPPTIGGFDGTSLTYDEVSATPITIAAVTTLTDSVGFDEDGYIEFSIDGAKSTEILDLIKVSSTSAISTVSNEVSIYGNTVYAGNGTSYDAVGQIDSTKNGQNGNPLRINFTRMLENANFETGATDQNFADKDVSGGTPTLPGWTVDQGTFSLTDNGYNTRSLGRALTKSGPVDGYYTMTGPDYSYQTDYNYTAAAHYYESVERPTGTLTTTVKIIPDSHGTGNSSLELFSRGSVVSNNNDNGITKYGSHFGPVVYSQPFDAKQGEVLSLDWKALYVSDDYEVYAYLKNTITNSKTLLFYGRGNNQPWKTSTATIPADGTYQFIFINGTYDNSGGFAVGSKLYIDNIIVSGQTISDSVAQAIIRKATYQSNDKDPATTRTLNLKVVNGNSETSTESATISITNLFDHAPEIATTAANPNFNRGGSSSGILFTGTSASTMEAAHTFAGLELQVTGLLDGSNEVLEVDGKDVQLTDGATGVTTPSSLPYQVGVNSGTATITLSGLSLSDPQMNTLIDGLEYKNTASSLSVGNRTITIKKLVDSGGQTGSNSNTTSLNLASVVSVSLVVDDFTYLNDRTTTTASFTWTAPSSATAIKIQKSTDGGSTWSDATHPQLATNSSSATVSGLTANTSYKFRLVVTGGDNAGISNVQTVSEFRYSGFSIVSRDTSTATFQWETISDATALTIQYSINGGLSWSNATHGSISTSATSAAITGLSSSSTYLFRLAATVSSQTIYSNTVGHPAAPTNVTATAGSGQATVSFNAPSSNGGSSITGYIVTASPGGITASGISSPITLVGLTNGTQYSFTVVAVNTVGNSVSSSDSALVTPTAAPSRSRSSNPNTATTTVNGQNVNIGTKTNETNKDGQSQTVIQVNPSTVSNLINTMEPGSTLTIPVTNGTNSNSATNTDASQLRMTVGQVDQLFHQNITLTVDTGQIQYSLPPQSIDVDNLVAKFGTGVDQSNIEFDITISDVPTKMLEVVQNTAAKDEFAIVIPPVEFNVTATYNGQTVSVNQFSQHVSREIALPAGTDPKKITTAIVVKEDGTTYHVPTDVYQKDGQWYARISSLTNSVYTLIYNEATFADTKGRWFEAPVAEAASRTILAGYEDGTFRGTNPITRAEFAAMIVNTLGLDRVGTSNYPDVKDSNWFYGVVSRASEYKVVSGRLDGSFDPNAYITRQEAMIMMQRAGEICGLVPGEGNAAANLEANAAAVATAASNTAATLSNDYADQAAISTWAREAVEYNLNVGLMKGSNGQLKPRDNITRAEAAVTILRLLQKSHLIDPRSAV